MGVTYPVGQFATFPIPDDIGDFGSGAVTLMGPVRRVRHPLRVRPRERGHRAVRPPGPAGRPRRRRTSPPWSCGAGSPGSPAPSGSSPRPGGPSPSTPCSAATSCGLHWCPASTRCSPHSTLSPAVPGVRPRREAPMELIGLYLIAAGLLVAAGVAKAARPDDTARAMAALLPAPCRSACCAALVRTGALAEAALGVRRPGVPAPGHRGARRLLSLLLRRGGRGRWRGGPLATCGCFGDPTRRRPRSTW